MRNILLEKLARSTPLSLGHAFCSQCKYPLSAFLSKDENNPEVIRIAAGGFTQTSVQERLSEILAADNFLRQCCGKAEALAKAIDVLFLDRLQAEAFPTNEPTLAFLPHLFEEALSKFDQVLYNEGDFKKYAYFHLYNLEIVGDLKLQPPYAGWFIAKLEPSLVPVLFGESSASSFISPMTTGTHFLVCQDTDGFEQENLYEWLSRRWQDAHPYRQVLQYAIEGIVNIDYVCPYFSPDWINKVHKWGLYYLAAC
ncbi:MAG: hypothetical protein KF722_14005 [Nitrospira sp.]|nr:hypothetical protein [Nitrospira sp.]